MWDLLWPHRIPENGTQHSLGKSSWLCHDHHHGNQLRLASQYQWTCTMLMSFQPLDGFQATLCYLDLLKPAQSGVWASRGKPTGVTKSHKQQRNYSASFTYALSSWLFHHSKARLYSSITSAGTRNCFRKACGPEDSLISQKFKSSFPSSSFLSFSC